MLNECLHTCVIVEYRDTSSVGFFKGATIINDIPYIILGRAFDENGKYAPEYGIPFMVLKTMNRLEGRDLEMYLSPRAHEEATWTKQ